MENQPYPPFLTFNNITSELKFNPDSELYQGYTYYFTIVVKEKNSDSVLYPYYCVVYISGEPIEIEKPN